MSDLCDGVPVLSLGSEWEGALGLQEAHPQEISGPGLPPKIVLPPSVMAASPESSPGQLCFPELSVPGAIKTVLSPAEHGSA